MCYLYNLKPVCFISAESWSTTAHLVVDTPPTGIVCLETLTAAVGWKELTQSCNQTQVPGMRLALTVAGYAQ